ncbi:major facilitator superfamily domain-containing protein [Aspergillus venezuelensis]
MWDIIRDSTFGQCLRLCSGRKVARYPEDDPNFQLPAGYLESCEIRCHSRSSYGSSSKDAEKGSKEASIAIIGWYGDDDHDNPYNWSFGKKLWVAILLFAYTFSVYIESSLYTTGTLEITQIYGVSNIVASLGLSMYIPAVGRTLPYITTYIIFVILCVPMSLVDNIAGILILRFLLGFFGSHCFATAGASYGDFYGPTAMPYVIALWGGGATLGPALGPLVAGFAVQAKGWRWSSWELLWLSGPIIIAMFFFMPETSSDYIPRRRAQRLRNRTGRVDLKSESGIRQQMNPRGITFNALLKSWEINILDPAVFFSTLYTASTYGIYYSFCESFPLVYAGLAFLSVLCGLTVAVVMLCLYFDYIAPHQLGKLDPVPPKARIWPGLFATWLIPMGLYIFAWTANPNIHWIVSLIGIAISMCGIFIITHCILFAGASILFSRPMFDGIKVSGGVTLLASFSVLCILGMFLLYVYGGKLRERSRFTGV